MIIKEIMNKAIVVDHDISLKEAAKIMSDKNIGSLVVIKGENIYGIVTEHDIMTNANNLNKKISSIMSKNVLTINENEDIDEAALVLCKNKIKRLPVVDKDEKLVGIITSTDLIAHSDELNEEFLFN